MAVFQLVVVMLKRALGVVGRINKNALDPARVERNQGFEGQQVVALYQQVVCMGTAHVPMDRLLFEQVVGPAG